eukprot:superscaffoldBa00000962_g8226
MSCSVPNRDSYWVINGLLLSEMTDTAYGMIQNFLYLNRYGFVPNGGRIYYEGHSQPPFLTLMVESYYQATKDKEFLGDFMFFLAKEQLWIDLKAGAESGWDFSSCWYLDSDGHNNSTLRETRTTQILPTDLNALLRLSEKTLASFHRIVGNSDSAALYDQAAARILEAIKSMLWDAERGVWFDYNLVTHSNHSEYYLSNLASVWVQCYSWLEMREKVLQYLKYDVNGDGKPGGGEEYEVQLGFGWTDSVGLQLLDQYGATLTSGCRRVSSGLLLPLVISVLLTLR